MKTQQWARIRRKACLSNKNQLVYNGWQLQATKKGGKEIRLKKEGQDADDRIFLQERWLCGRDSP